MLGPSRSIASWRALRQRGPDRARHLELGNTVLQHRVREIGNAVLDRVVEPLEFGGCLGRALAQFGDMRRSALGTFLAAIENARKRARQGGALIPCFFRPRSSATDSCVAAHKTCYPGQIGIKFPLPSCKVGFGHNETVGGRDAADCGLAQEGWPRAIRAAFCR